VSKLLNQLQSNYNALFARYDMIVDTCHAESRQPDGLEESELAQLRGEMDALGPRVLQLRDDEERRMTTVLPLPGDPVESRSTLVHVNREPEVYRRDLVGEVSFFKDLLHAQLDGEPESRSRIDRHQLMMRAMGSTTTGAGVIPPTWLFEEFAILQHGARPWADVLRRVGIKDANPISIGKQVTPGAAVTAQAAEGNPPNDGSFNTSTITVNPVTYTGKTDVSRQLIDGSNPSIDGIVYADCLGSYYEAIEQAVVNAFEAATGLAATISYPGTPAYSNLADAIVDAAASVNKHRKQPATAVLMGIGAWAFALKMKDTQGRPLVTTGSAGGPLNALGQANAVQVLTGVAGHVVGLPVVPSWAGVDNHIYVLKADDSLLLESSTYNFRYEEVLWPSAIRLGVWGYAAPVIARYPSSIAQINAGTTIPSPAEGDVEITEAEPAARSGRK
jgi:HK97 family phage major capsid protein